MALRAFGGVSSRCQNKANPPSCNSTLQNTLSGPEFCGRIIVFHGAFEYEGGQDRGVCVAGVGGLPIQKLCPLCPLGPSDLASLCRTCLPHLMASFFFNNCMFDMCKYQGLQQMLCVHMAALTEACQAAGYMVKPWRGPQFCCELCREPGEGEGSASFRHIWEQRASI